MVMSNSKLRSAVFQQSHFLGVLIPEDITLTLEDCRRSGYGTPIHVTLVPQM